MKFDFCIGNPPYQGENHMQLYPDFYLQSQKISKCLEMIFPVGWQKPKNANNLKKMNSNEVKRDRQIVFINNIQNAFPSLQSVEWTNIVMWKEGYDNGLHGKQRILTNGQDEHLVLIPTESSSELSPEMKSALKKIHTFNEFIPLSSIILRSESYKFSDKMHVDNPEIRDLLSTGHKYDLKSSVLEKLDGIIFFNNLPNDGYEYSKVLGLVKSQRVSRWIRKEYLKESPDFDKYKVFVAEAASSGIFGEKLSQTIVADPKMGHTQTYISIGAFNSKVEAINADKYIKTKFARALLFTLKTTQHNGVGTWANIPLQDFSVSSDIDWTKSLHNIDFQLYKKYGLSDDEIAFIEGHVKEMD